MLRLIKIQNTLLLLFFGLLSYAQEVELVKPIPFLNKGEYFFDLKGFIGVGKQGESIRIFRSNGDLLIDTVYEDLDVHGGWHQRPIRLKKNGKFGFLSHQGKEISPFEYDKQINGWNCGCTIMKKNESYYILDTIGNEMELNVDIDFGGNLSVETNGLIVYEEKERNNHYRYLIYDWQEKKVQKIEGFLLSHSSGGRSCEYSAFKTKNKQAGLIDSKGRVVVPAKNNFYFRKVGNSIYFKNEEGTFRLDDSGQITHLSDEQISMNGLGMDSLASGFVWLKKTQEGHQMAGIMNNHFQKVTPAKYDFMRKHGEDQIIFIGDNGLRGMFNNDGEILIENKYLELLPVSESDITAKVHSGKYILLNKEGEQTIPFEFDRIGWAWPRDRFEIVSVKIASGQGYVLYNIAKQKQLDGNFEFLKFYKNNPLILVENNRKYGVMDYDGNYILEMGHRWISKEASYRLIEDDNRITRGIYARNMDGEWFYDFNENKKSRIDYSPSIHKVGDDFFWVKSKDKWEVYKTKE